jgi:putative transposase
LYDGRRLRVLNVADSSTRGCNGPEFVSKVLAQWASRNGVTLDFSRPGKPTDNAFVESFNGMFRAKCLDPHWFTSLTETQQIVETWRREYIESRPHRALGEKTPNEFVNESRLAATSLGNKQPKTRTRVGTITPVRSVT